MESRFKVGICKEMCPVRETNFRRKNGLIHDLEISKESGKIRAVKSYSRCAAGSREAEEKDLRTPETCLLTAKYLIQRILIPKTCTPTVYAFIFDRLRAIRQDLIIQGDRSNYSVEVLCICVRFMLYSGYILSGTVEGETIKFDRRQNYDQLLECLKSLLNLYVDMEYEPSSDMVAIYLLLEIGSSKPLTWLLEWNRDLIRQSTSVCRAYEINLRYMERNFVSLFKLASNCDVVLLLGLHLNLPRIYREIFETTNVAYGTSNCKFPLDSFCKLYRLTFAESDALIKTHLKIDLPTDGSYIPFRRQNLILRPKLIQRRAYFIDKQLKPFDITSYFF